MHFQENSRATGNLGGSNLGGSSRITLRGINSITGNNQPLYVIDGVPLDNSELNSSSTINGSAGKDMEAQFRILTLMILRVLMFSKDLQLQLYMAQELLTVLFLLLLKMVRPEMEGLT